MEIKVTSLELISIGILIGVAVLVLIAFIFMPKETIKPVADPIPPVLKSAKPVVSDALKDLQAAYAKNRSLLELIFNRPMTDYSLMSVEGITVTAYSAVPDETDDSPELTADLTDSRIGLLAVSRDMLQYLSYGQIVILPPYGMFRVSDTMNPRFKNRVDILHASKLAARNFGIHKNMTLYWVE